MKYLVFFQLKQVSEQRICNKGIFFLEGEYEYSPYHKTGEIPPYYEAGERVREIAVQYGQHHFSEDVEAIDTIVAIRPVDGVQPGEILSLGGGVIRTAWGNWEAAQDVYRESIRVPSSCEDEEDENE